MEESRLKRCLKGRGGGDRHSGGGWIRLSVTKAHLTQGEGGCHEEAGDSRLLNCDCIDNSNDLRWENSPANRSGSRETELEMSVTLLATCCGSKSLKVILIDSDFRADPCPQSPCPSRKTGSITSCIFDALLLLLRTNRELEYTCPLKITFTQGSHDRGFKT